MNKVLAIAPYSYLPFSSGGQKFIAQFLEYLGKEVDLTVISVAENDFTLAKTYKTIPLLKKTFKRYLDTHLVAKISSLVKEKEFDTIIWEHPYYWWLAARIRKKTGIKTIIHTHNIEYQRFQSLGKWWSPFLKIYERVAFNKADAIFFITNEDKEYAITHWNVAPEKCIDVPFGVEIKETPDDKKQARKNIAEKHSINSDEKILLFNGVLDYKPNLAALKIILTQINPLLLAHTGFKYKMIVCGKRLPVEMNSLKEYANKNIIYTGFVTDVDTYFKGADIFLNPVQSGGGIKTKMVEAIAFGTTVVATETGAIGLDEAVAGNKLDVVKDNDWTGFAEAIIKNAVSESATPPSYYSKYYWGNIIEKIVSL